MTSDVAKKPATMEELVQRFKEEKQKASSSFKPIAANLQAVYKEVNRFKSIYDKMEKRAQTLEMSNNTEVQDATDDVKQRYELLEKRFNQMNNKNSKLRARNTLLERDKEVIAEELEKIKADFNALTLEVNRLRGLNSSLKKREEPESLVQQLRQRNAELQQQNNELLNKLASGDDHSLLQDTVKVQILQKDISELKSVIHELENKNEKMQREAHSYLNEDLKLENDKLKYTLKEREERYRELKNEYEATIQSFTNGAKCTSELQTENSELRQTLQGTQDALHVTQQELNKALARLATLTKLEAENEKLRAKVKEQALQLQDSCKNLQMLNGENNSINEKLKSMMIENCKLHKHLEEILEGHDELSAVKEREAELQERLGRIDAENRQLRAHIKYLLEDVQKKSKNLEEFNQTLKDKKLNLENDVDGLRRELNDALDMVRTRTSDLSSLQNSENRYKQKIGQLEEEIARLNQEIMGLAERNRVTAGTINELKNREAGYRQKLANLEKENGQLKVNLEEVHKELNSRTTQLKNIQAIQQDTECSSEHVPIGTMDYLHGIVYQLQQGNGNLQKAYDSLLQECNILKLKRLEEEEKLRKDNQLLKEKLDEAGTELYGLREELLLLKHDMALTEEENKSLKDSYEKFKSTPNYNDRLMQFKQKVAALAKDNLRLKSELDRVLAELQNNRKSNEEATKLKKRVQQLEAEIVKLTRDIETNGAHREKLKALEAENVQLKRDLKMTVRNITQEAKNNVELKEINWQLAKKVDNLETLLDNAMKRCENHTAHIHDNKKLQIKVRDMEVDVALMRRELENCAEEMQALEKCNRDLTEECSKLKQANHRLRVEYRCTEKGEPMQC